MSGVGSGHIPYVTSLSPDYRSIHSLERLLQPDKQIIPAALQKIITLKESTIQKQLQDSSFWSVRDAMFASDGTAPYNRSSIITFKKKIHSSTVALHEFSSSKSQHSKNAAPEALIVNYILDM